MRARIAEIQRYRTPASGPAAIPTSATTGTASFEQALASAAGTARVARPGDPVVIAAAHRAAPPVDPSAVGGNAFPNVPTPHRKVDVVIAFARAGCSNR